MSTEPLTHPRQDEQPRTAAPLPVLDQQKGLRYLGGNVNGYHRLLCKFVALHQGDMAVLQSHLAAQRGHEAHAVVHQLKGLSATLGLSALNALVIQVEKQVLAGSPLAQWQDEMAALTHSFAQALTEINALRLDPATGQAVAPSREQAQTLLPQLLQQLKDADFQAVSLWRDLRQSLHAWVSPTQMDQLDHAIDRFEFATAATLLAQIKV